uniref:Uncharacterized protein n=1 Tax=Arundo donax TaxID=35708 RepID=A0A0A9H0F1_ARUDO
MYTRCLVKQGV